ncbi:radical SAM-linked protein [Streptoalloteichus hindustanus]|uniref:Radical SAM-linked protein n=1 Tax=Streptoalloteichus hindustanus TaxID=2017 RepID=A0A1M5BPJ5_STRHI|nr:radical SAM-linked protein [Streptoalloteichus hindustanus]
MARTFERALRRAGVPMAYSQGFSPHPKVSWVGAAPTGVASEAEYVEIQVVRELDPEALRRELDAALPPGLDVLEAVTGGPGSLAERIEASLWRVELPGVEPAELAEAVRRLLAAERVDVERLTKDGRRTLDARAAVVSAEVVTESTGDTSRGTGGTSRTAHILDTSDQVEPAALADANGLVTDSDQESGEATAQVADWPERARPCGILVAVVRQTTPAVRPDDVLSALRVVADLVPPVPAKATRMAQGRLDDSGVLGTLVDPLAADRAASPTTTPSGVDDPAVR